ncbi:hypothetical protein VNO77_19439 [Canavalia gladiata]|uniref:Uncharacterized protein n=1 Tax=Canavalia gladiata TaxID=3824 RepID=A0AAN9QKH8_CANGL
MALVMEHMEAFYEKWILIWWCIYWRSQFNIHRRVLSEEVTMNRFDHKISKMRILWLISMGNLFVMALDFHAENEGHADGSTPLRARVRINLVIVFVTRCRVNIGYKKEDARIAKKARANRG